MRIGPRPRVAELRPARLRGVAFVDVAEEVFEGAAGLIDEALGHDGQRIDAVEAEASEVFAQFAPGGERPDGAPEEEAKRADDALGVFANVVPARLTSVSQPVSVNVRSSGSMRAT